MPYKNTTQLAEGDIVLDHGMRILLDGPATIHPLGDRPEDPVYRWPGLVLNADELCDKGSPSYNAYIACHIRGQWREDIVPLPRLDDWPVQGNHLAMWTTEEKEPT